MSYSPELVRQLIRVMVEFTWFFDTCDDEVLDTDDAVKQMEGCAFLLNQLGDEDKQVLIDELAAMTAEETEPVHREYLKNFAFAGGLVEDEPS